MHIKEYQDDRILVICLERGEEITSCIDKIAKQYNIQAAIVTGIGAISDITVGLFHNATRKFCRNEFHEDLEIVNLSGNLSLKDGAHYAHLHITVANSIGKAFGGHLVQATVSATAELFIRILPEPIERKFSEEIGINLMSL